MVIKEFSAIKFRNYQELFLPLSAGIYLITGDNGQGKTNLVEGFYFLCHLASFRTSRLEQLIAFGASQSFLQGVVNKNDTDWKARIEISRRGRRVWLDEEPVPKLSSYISRFHSLLFNPDNLYNYRNFPGERRSFYDRVLSFIDSDYLEALRSFKTINNQKNKLLKKEDLSSLPAWNRLFVEKGCVIIKKRREITADLNNRLPRIPSNLTGKAQQLALEYHPSLTGDLETDSRTLENLIERERQAGRALQGPHRDEFLMTMPAGRGEAFFSQGESRVTLLAVLLALNEVLTERMGYRPAVILDDLYSELDSTVQENLTRHLHGLANQIFITTTHPPPVLKHQAVEILQIQDGRIV